MLLCLPASVASVAVAGADAAHLQAAGADVTHLQAMTAQLLDVDQASHTAATHSLHTLLRVARSLDAHSASPRASSRQQKNIDCGVESGQVSSVASSCVTYGACFVGFDESMSVFSLVQDM